MDKKDSAYKNLQKHHEEVKDLKMRTLFADDPNRYSQFSIEFEDLLLDYSKNRVTSDTMDMLFKLARAAGVESWRDQMFAGELINNTEQRAVLHTALRNLSDREVNVGGKDVMPAIRKVNKQMFDFSGRIHRGEWRGYTGDKITDVVNIGIGGSDLGPKMVCEALDSYKVQGIKVHFLSNIDGVHTQEILQALNPETTLFIVSSKTFTTQETMTNARVAKEWLLQAAKNPSAVAKHFVAVSTNRDAVTEFGIDPGNMFEFWEWVGGRYSLWSAIGLSILLFVGEDNFRSLLAGAHAMDKHFMNAPLESNLPVILAMLGIWYGNYFDAETQVVLPYDHCLRSFPTYLQQTDMESNGKSVDREGNPVNYQTGPVVWGSSGINGQHAFYQLIHQGTRLIPVDFIVTMETPSSLRSQHDILVSNCLAQSEALMRGRTPEETQHELLESGIDVNAAQVRAPHMVFGGNHPSNVLLLKKLSPYNLGALIALYEHKIFVQGIVWNINSFDQWGVELGKQLTNVILSELDESSKPTIHDSSTQSLIQHYRQYRQNNDDA